MEHRCRRWSITPLERLRSLRLHRSCAVAIDPAAIHSTYCMCSTEASVSLTTQLTSLSLGPSYSPYSLLMRVLTFVTWRLNRHNMEHVIQTCQVAETTRVFLFNISLSQHPEVRALPIKGCPCLLVKSDRFSSWLSESDISIHLWEDISVFRDRRMYTGGMWLCGTALIHRG
jgi:hypothetical protein